MQKLNRRLKGQKGSTLVGAVALTTIMAIGVAGLMGASRGTAENEFTASLEAKALLAAESGLLIGTKWFKDQTMIAGSTTLPNITTLNGVDVDVDFKPNGLSHVDIISTATVEGLPYKKQLKWTVPAVIKPKVEPPDNGMHIANAVPDTGQHALRGGDRFYGPVHFNNGPLIMFNTSEQDNANAVRFFGKVTVYNEPGTNVHNYGDSPKGNYNQGIYVKSFNDGFKKNQVAALDATFDVSFEISQKKYEITFDPNPPIAHIKHTLAQTASGQPNVLTFGVTGGVGWYTVDGIKYFLNQDLANNPILPMTPRIIEANFPLKVTSGEMSGHVTVRSTGIATNGNIFIDLSGNSAATSSLLYSGISPTSPNVITTGKNLDNEVNTNWRVGMEKADVLAFYTDNGNIVFNTTGSLTGVLTAQLFAPKGTLKFNTAYNSTGNAYNSGKVIRVVGVASMFDWWDDAGNNNSNLSFAALFDKRGIVPIGVGTDDNVSITVPPGSVPFTKTNWTERNCVICT